MIDPGDEVDEIRRRLDHNGLKVKTILHTHAHIDHIGGTFPLQEATGARVYVHGEDEFLFKMLPEQGRLLGVPAGRAAEIDAFAKDGDVFSFGSASMEAIHTPGHTPGSLSFHVAGSNGGKLFTGDTLFLGSIGRTDLWGGSFDEIMKSIRQRLLTMDDDTVVYPGHGPATTIGQEKRINPFILNG